MSSTLSKSDRQRVVDTVDVRMTKAELPVNHLSNGLTAIVRDALQDHYGSLKAAAITLDMDLGQLSRELANGDFKLKRLDIDPDARREVLSALYEAVRDTDPKATQKRLIRNARRALDDLAEAL